MNQKTVALCIRTTKLTAETLRAAMRAYLRAHNQKKQQKMQAPKLGKITVKELAKQNAGMTNIEITKKNIRAFERYARRYRINYALKKDKTKVPPVYLVFFKGRDQDAINAAFRDFSVAQIKRANKPTIHQQLQKFRSVLKFPKIDKVREKHQEQSR